MWEEHRGEPATGKVIDIDEGMAHVLVGDDEEEWYFPLTTLPVGTKAGDGLLLVKVDLRYKAIRRLPCQDETSGRSIEDRMARRIVRDRVGSPQVAEVSAPRSAARAVVETSNRNTGDGPAVGPLATSA